MYILINCPISEQFCIGNLFMGESFQDYSWIQDFEAGLSTESQPQIVELGTS